MFSRFSFYFLVSYIVILLFSLCFFVPIFESYGYFPSNVTYTDYSFFEITSSEFLWPTPGFTQVTSSFGHRIAPTSGAFSYHSGIDIASPVGSNIISIFSGTITYTGFNGAGGYSLSIKNKHFIASYCHLSPTFLVFNGQFVKKGDVIAKIGTKNVYNVSNNPYKDSHGSPTNRCHYWTSFAPHFKKKRQSRQSFRLFLNIY